MKLLRNPEIAKTVLLQLLLSIAATAFLWQRDRLCGIAALIVCCLFLLIYLLTTGKRYRQIAELSSDIDRILHGDNLISLEKYSEGELAVLHSEIYKMIVRLKEQQQKLSADKLYLADSLADISHQIRTPLTSMNLLISLLSDPSISEERRQQLSQEIYELLARIDWLITTLLKISKLDAKTIQFKKEVISLVIKK